MIISASAVDLNDSRNKHAIVPLQLGYLLAMNLNKKTLECLATATVSDNFKFHSNKAKCFVAATMRPNATIIVAIR